MPRSTHWINSRSTLAVLVFATVILSLLPPRPVSWAAWLSERPVTLVLAPIQKSMGTVVGWFVRRPEARKDAGPADALAQKVRELETELLKERSENEHLRAQIAEFSLAPPAGPDAPRQVFAGIIGGGADPASGALKAKVGSADGVEVDAVAVLRGVNLVGRVVRVAPRWCFILPITARSARRIEGVIMLSEQTVGPGCSLEATGDGALRGPVIYPEGQPGMVEAVKKGLLVRLSDGTWPASAQMLVIGRIEQVNVGANQRQTITVRPITPLDRIPEVVLRIPVHVQGEDAP